MDIPTLAWGYIWCDLITLGHTEVCGANLVPRPSAIIHTKRVKSYHLLWLETQRQSSVRQSREGGRGCNRIPQGGGLLVCRGA